MTGLALGLLVLRVGPELVTFTAVGESWEEPRAEALGVDLAFSDAVKKLTPEPLRKNLLLSGRVLADPKSFVRGHKVKKRVGPHTTVEVEVDVAALRAAIDEVQGRVRDLGSHRVLLYLREHSPLRARQGLPENACTNALREALIRDGWSLATPEGQLSTGEVTDEEIDRIGRKSHVELVVGGELTFENEGMCAPARFKYRVEVTEPVAHQVRFRADGSEENPPTDWRRCTWGTEEELCEHALTPVLWRVAGAVLEAAAKAKVEGTPLTLKLSHVTAEQLVSLQASLKTVPNVVSVSPHGEATDAGAVLDVSFTGKPAELAKALRRVTPKLSVAKVSGAIIEAEPAE